jgi:YdjC-like protein
MTRDLRSVAESLLKKATIHERWWSDYYQDAENQAFYDQALTWMTRRLIITADEYGMCASVNHAIDECLGAGTVRATCVMVNMPLFNATASLRHKFPNFSVGIHWTLTQGRPILTPAQLPTLVGPNGEFHPVLEFRHRMSWEKPQ